ncbi:MAG TPA: hypothetical protein VG146_09670, partial [Verrucomicrobiae bacterium]|nr:hypothetical protein [Verrucomicrobiae bacterium]
SLVVGHLGLAAPSRNIFVVRRWDPFIPDNTVEVSWPPGTVPDYIWERNFDPRTLAPTAYLNGLLFAGNYIQQAGHAEVQLFPADPDVPLGFTVADGFSGISPFGAFYTGLSYDDVGGLRFLLNQTNVNYATLLPDVQLAPGSDPQQKLVDGAWRAGVEKITFVQQSFDSEWQPIPMTVPFTDTYFTNGIVMQQAAQRVVSQPDFLFCAGDNGPTWPTGCPWQRSPTAAQLLSGSSRGRLCLAAFSECCRSERFS